MSAMSEPHPRDPEAPASSTGRARLRDAWRAYRRQPREKVGFWLGLLLLFVPVFYFLLYVKPYSVTARVGWGLWLGFIVVAKLSGMAEPVIDIQRITDELDAPENAAARAPQRPSLDEYMALLDRGLLGYAVAGYEAGEGRVHVRLEVAGDAFAGEEDVALAGVSSAFSLLYGQGFGTVVLDFAHPERGARMTIDRGAFNRFFGLSEAEMRELVYDRDKMDDSPLQNMDAEDRRAFYERFAEPR